MKILAVSEFGKRGSGYSTILAGLLREWQRRFYEVTVLAFDYSGFEHPFNAAIIPTDPNRIQQHSAMVRAGFKPDVICVIYDLSFHYSLRALQQAGVPYIGIFVVESDPLVHPSDWTGPIDTMGAALCASQFGTDLLVEAGLRARHIPIGIDTEFWRRPTDEEKADSRKRWNLDGFVVLTVADNQERKNLPAHAAAISLLAGYDVQWPVVIGKTQAFPTRDGDVRWVLNTKRRPRQAGYQLAALVDRFSIRDRTLLLEHDDREGLDPERLRELYWAADAFLALSKAEGFGIPVMEAMACGVPVVGTDCTGIREQIHPDRGFLVSPEYVHIDPFHNQYRRWADPYQAAIHLDSIRRRGHARQMADRAHEYVQARTWKAAGDVFEEALRELTDPKTEASAATATPG